MMTSTGPAERRAGRPRDPGIDAAVLRATVKELESTGYQHLSLAVVAEQAGTTKPALYRRWPSKQQLVLDALSANLGELVTPLTECTLCDFVDGILIFLDAFHRMPPNVLAPLLADCDGDPELRAAFMRTLFDPPRAAVDRVITHALAQGDLRPDVDRSLVLDFLASFVYYRVLFQHESATMDEIESAVSVLLRGMATDFQRLLEIADVRRGNPAVHEHHMHLATAGA
ncbi:TetR/AcrR family transcriptional regulator [Gryllotalpicola reticulitermitis]|uniref:TetR/AcrR family transcriptional regulator n=1 Tax=Gryllotalpicola reticulitermitis TaxID=1184153 RepID=A0ABV8Q5K3_9MICO